MKRIAILIMTLIPFVSFGQEMQLKIKIVDNTNQMDSVLIGKNNSASNGIDESFDESNLYGTSFGDIDIRSIQRTQENHECLTESLNENTGNPLYFSENNDLKIDIRSDDFFNPLENCFELKFSATEYPIKIIIDISEYPYNYSHIYWVGIFDSECNLIQEIDMNEPWIDTVEISSGSNINRIILKKDHETGIKDYESDSHIKIFPNPLSKENELQIEGLEYQEAIFELYSISGEIIMQKLIKGDNSLRLDNSEIISGIYFYKLLSNENVLKTGKIILE